MPSYGYSKGRFERKFWEKAAERGDVQYFLRRPEEGQARREARDDIEEKLTPGYKACKKDKEHVEHLSIEIQLREKYANEEKDALERQLRESREAAGRRFTLVTAPSPEEDLYEAPGSNEYGQVASQTYQFHRECPLHSENGTERFEFPREVPTRPQNQAGRDLHYQRYDPSQPSGGLYGQGYPERHYKGSSSYSATNFYSSDHELEGDMPAAHVSSVTRGGPYEVSEQQYFQSYVPPGASLSGNWV